MRAAGELQQLRDGLLTQLSKSETLHMSATQVPALTLSHSNIALFESCNPQFLNDSVQRHSELEAQKASLTAFRYVRARGCRSVVGG
jgi:hypothetical protein